MCGSKYNNVYQITKSTWISKIYNTYNRNIKIKLNKIGIIGNSLIQPLKQYQGYVFC